ncbi:MAG: GTP cyclohydrolase II [Candidatus Cloacimonadota bacterium]|nr:GTP cyclohydrolase II [Candidatus Cloacimonadota bacterium]
MMNEIPEIIDDLKIGKMVIVVDDETRENEGDLVMLAEHTTPEKINFMLKEARGLLCAPISQVIAQKLQLPIMVQENTDTHHTAFTVSVDHISTDTGISAKDRAVTLKELASEKAQADDFRKPGHIFPLLARKGGLTQREGHTEAAIELARLAKAKPVGVICEIMNEDGSMARMPDLEKFSQKHNLKLISVTKLKRYLERTAFQPEVVVDLPTKYGDFKLYAFLETNSTEPHLALVKGEPSTAPNPPLTRVHSECLTGDLLNSLKCDCGDQLQQAFQQIGQKEDGIIIYLRQEGRGIGLLNKLKAYQLQKKGYDTVEANLELGFKPEMRKFSAAARILKYLQVKKVELMTNNPFKIEELQKYGIEVSQRIAVEIEPNEYNFNYLKTKKEKMQHFILGGKK